MSRDQVEADWLLEHGRTREEVARMQAAARPGALVVDYADLLQVALTRLEADRDAYGTSYGSFYGGDPRHFSPDPECSTAEERADHALACAAADRAEAGADNLERRTIPGAFSQDQRFGLGTTTHPDPEVEGLIAGLREMLKRMPVI